MVGDPVVVMLGTAESVVPVPTQKVVVPEIAGGVVVAAAVTVVETDEVHPFNPVTVKVMTAEVVFVTPPVFVTVA